MTERGRPRYPDVLTPRQQEVLRLVGDGLSNREIAERLEISFDGAKFHVREIIRRLGVTSRREAAEWLERRNGEQPAASMRLGWRGGRCGRRRPAGTRAGHSATPLRRWHFGRSSMVQAGAPAVHELRRPRILRRSTFRRYRSPMRVLARRAA